MIYCHDSFSYVFYFGTNAMPARLFGGCRLVDLMRAGMLYGV